MRDNIQNMTLSIGTKLNQNKWRKEAQDAFVRLVQRVGLPTRMSSEAGGEAMWDAGAVGEFGLHEIVITDKGVMSWTEAPDSMVPCRVRVTVKYNVSSTCFGSALQIHDGLMYDPQYHELHARSGSFETCIAVLASCMSIDTCLDEAGILMARSRLQAVLRIAVDAYERNLEYMQKAMKKSFRSTVHVDSEILPAINRFVQKR